MKFLINFSVHIYVSKLWLISKILSHYSYSINTYTYFEPICLAYSNSIHRTWVEHCKQNSLRIYNHFLNQNLWMGIDSEIHRMYHKLCYLLKLWKHENVEASLHMNSNYYNLWYYVDADTIRDPLGCLWVCSSGGTLHIKTGRSWMVSQYTSLLQTVP